MVLRMSARPYGDAHGSRCALGVLSDETRLRPLMGTLDRLGLILNASSRSVRVRTEQTTATAYLFAMPRSSQFAVNAEATKLPGREQNKAGRNHMGRDLVQIDDYDLNSFIRLAARFGHARYSFVVTPNADHLIRLNDDRTFKQMYSDAEFVLLDSRFVAHLLRLTRGVRLPVCTGSDLTARLLEEVVRPNDPIILIGGSSEQAAMLARQYGLRQLVHYNPPMGFIHDSAAVDQTLRFIEDHSPFRFCFLAVGAPQQEELARRLKVRGIARGLALCIGASINFLTGSERRAPLWMQRAGLEWLYRLQQNPARMAHRYLVRCPRIFALLALAIISLRPAAYLLPERARVAVPRDDERRSPPQPLRFRPLTASSPPADARPSMQV